MEFLLAQQYGYKLEPCTLPPSRPMVVDTATQDDGMLMIRAPQRDLLIANGTHQYDIDDNLDEVVKQDPVKVEPLKFEGRGGGGCLTWPSMPPMPIDAEIVRFRIREILARDTYINSATDYYGLALKDRIKDLTKSDVNLSSKQDRKDRKLGGNPRRIRDIQLGTITSHYPARILAAEKLGDMKEKSLSIKLYYHHNHVLASLENIVTAQKSERTKTTIKSLLLQGAFIRSDVYYIWHTINTTAMRKDSDTTLSVMKWLEEIEGKGGFTFYNRVDTAKGVFYGFTTVWQLRQLRYHSQSLCLDGTYNGPKTNLFTLVLKNKDMESVDSSILIAWLRALCEKMKQVFSTPAGATPTGEPTAAREYNYTPNAVITGQGNNLRSRLPSPAHLSSRQGEAGSPRHSVRAVAMHLIAQFRVRWTKQQNLKYFNKTTSDEDPTFATSVPEGPAVVAVVEGPTVIAAKQLQRVKDLLQDEEDIGQLSPTLDLLAADGIPLLKFLKFDREDIHHGMDLLAWAPKASHYQRPHVPGLGLSYYLDRIVSLEALRDIEKSFPHEPDLYSLLERFFTTFED
ncbi:MAG: hypothetical protein J3R72DRAFT_517198 [Linnemannia gamsii]|nr:MAG: hypothetical protein J3R72DRAFT_517198 [Linnemannia gamsii]